MRDTSVDMVHVLRAARLLSSPTRLRIMAVLPRKETSVSDLAARLDVEQDLISWHLRALRAAHLVSARRWGRLVVYRIDADRIPPALAIWQRLRRQGDHPPRDHASGSPRSRMPDLRQARTCYDHLAGGAGVHVLKKLLDRGWLLRKADGKGPEYALTARGTHALRRRGVNVLRAYRVRRKLAYGCADWSAPHRHLGGALGAEILAALFNATILSRVGRSRRLLWRRPIAAWLGQEKRLRAEDRLRAGVGKTRRR